MKKGMDKTIQLLVGLGVVALVLYGVSQYMGAGLPVPNSGALQMRPTEGSEYETPSTANLSANLASPELRNKTCYPKEQLQASDLLPNSEDNLFAQVNPSVPETMSPASADPSFLIGIDTVGQTLRNPNLQLRSEPPNPQFAEKITPFNQPTIGPDMQRRPFELGQC